MSSYKRFIIFCFLIFSIFGCSQSQSNFINNAQKYKYFSLEDQYIMFALEYYRLDKKTKSRNLFLKLYDNTLKEEYLLEYLNISYNLKKYDDIIKKVNLSKKTISNNYNNIFRVYILALIENKKYDEALLEAINLIEKFELDSNYDLLANIYFNKKNYDKAKELYKKVYKNNLSANSLMNLVNVMYIYLDEKEQAINFLESHSKLYGCQNIVCSRLLSIYQEQNNIDGLISVLKRTYYEYKNKSDEFSLKKVYKLLMFYLEKKDIKEAIEFLENSKIDDEKLFILYRNDSQYEKAYKLVNKLYNDSSNIDYLAQIAILEFEIAKDKKKVLHSVITKFEQVLTILNNHIYENYLGYLLINYDIDVNKGLDYVNKALKKSPNNLAYIDSLAWGQYKLKDCKNAKKNMKKVVDGAGLNDLEIKMHWKKIKECSK
ncbi:MAG: hypothetical protein GY932_14940 [Arcobacter sp.]|nr:hypothetical protein [Arcobacter sp.]